ncbi:hypothetical protein AB4156_19195 [Cupriavidus sp. 2MCAB6]|uniref:hypothetical protein n=1 Tax=Cupriavidus sp. 2MCAB6 TaxID=3232981 RepID=UPI003F90F22A
MNAGATLARMADHPTQNSKSMAECTSYFQNPASPSTTPTSCFYAVVQGLGLAQMSDFQIIDHLALNELVVTLIGRL